MKNIILFSLITLFFTATIYCQTDNEKAILKAIDSYNMAVKNGDTERIKLFWVQDQEATWVSTSKNYYSYLKGWSKIEKFLDESQDSDFILVKDNPKITRIGKDYALVENLLTLKSKSDSSSFSVNINSFYLKQKKIWKIASRVATMPETYQNSLVNLENDFILLGYGFLGLKETEKAIEIFKLNVKYFPNNWNGFDSLAEAYAEAGEKKLAIENYEKSLVLNPQSKSGIEALKKLKNQK